MKKTSKPEKVKRLSRTKPAVEHFYVIADMRIKNNWIEVKQVKLSKMFGNLMLNDSKPRWKRAIEFIPMGNI